MERDWLVHESHERASNDSNDVRPFPSNADEVERLDIKHLADIIVFDGLFPCPKAMVDAVLAPSPAGDVPKKVLDVGCGTGAWALGVAKLYPTSEVLGIDRVPVPLEPPVSPPNLRFQAHDINAGLEPFRAQYDVVQAKSIMVGVTDVDQTLKELQLCLKPGGLLVLVEGDMILWDRWYERVKPARVEGDRPFEGQFEESWLQRLFLEVGEAAAKAGSQYYRAVESLDLGLWNQPWLDPETAGGGSAYLPVGPWSSGATPSDTEKLRQVGTFLRTNFLKKPRSFRSMLLRDGVPFEIAEDRAKRATEELTTMNPRMYARYTYCWARRRAGKGLPAPPLPTLTSIPPERGYPVRELYTTAEEARLARENRMKSADDLLVAAVRKGR